MKVENKFRDWMSDWKKLEGETEKKAFLQKMKSDIDNQDGEGLLDGMKSLNVMIKELRDEVVKPSGAVKEQFVVSPLSAEETALLRNLLTKMNIKFTEVKTARPPMPPA